MYPNSIESAVRALAFGHTKAEIESVRYALTRPPDQRTPEVLLAFARGFSRKFVENPITITYKPRAPDQFNHTRRILQIGKPEMVRVLHELGHAKLGLSEDQAVAYSLGLILKALPEFVPVLNGHVLENDPY